MRSMIRINETSRSSKIRNNSLTTCSVISKILWTAYIQQWRQFRLRSSMRILTQIITNIQSFVATHKSHSSKSFINIHRQRQTRKKQKYYIFSGCNYLQILKSPRTKNKIWSINIIVGKFWLHSNELQQKYF